MTVVVKKLDGIVIVLTEHGEFEVHIPDGMSSDAYKLWREENANKYKSLKLEMKKEIAEKMAQKQK